MKFSGIKVAVITSESSTGEVGGAERFYSGLINGLREIGCNVDRIAVSSDESSFATIIETYEHCSKLDLSRYDAVISTKAPTFAVKHINHVMYLVHTIRVFDDMFYENFKSPDALRLNERFEIHHRDFVAMRAAKRRFSIGHTVTNRLRRLRGIETEVIHPPLGFDGFTSGPQGDYIFMPGRLHPWKRVDLAIRAVLDSDLPVRLVISGSGEAEDELKALAAGDSRIEFVGRLSDEDLLQYYSNCLAVAFIPRSEDYGYVTLEAFASSKPVITCVDSGEPNFFINHMENGIRCEPNVKSVKEAFEWMYNNRDQAESFGKSALKTTESHSWSNVATQLITAAMAPEPQIGRSSVARVAIVDMQPIDPPVGGGRMRLLGLYHALGSNIDATYVGSYDWPGENYREQKLSPTLTEIIVPLSASHHKAAMEYTKYVGGKTVIDVLFSQQAHLSNDYIEQVKKQIKLSDIVIFSHPWVFPLVDKRLLDGKLVVYDAQNIEGFLRTQLFDGNKENDRIVINQVIEDEYELLLRADLVLACSHDDLLGFQKIYGINPEKMRLMPNGVMAFSHEVPNREQKAAAKSALKLTWETVAIFLGSAYKPNLEAAHFIVNKIAPHLPDTLFVIAGGVCAEMPNTTRKNVIYAGALSEDDKLLWLSAADIALNPMFSGSGTNIKMFDFMAMGLPTITTKIGARGIDLLGKRSVLISEPTAESFVTFIRALQDPDLHDEVSNFARRCVEQNYSWEYISDLLGHTLISREKYIGQSKPYFSVIVPTYERHEQLDELMSYLQEQIERDFEVVIVDQSATLWPSHRENFGFPITYYHAPVKGAVRARNTGAILSAGSILAFTDDDCRPNKNWLINARKYFQENGVVGVEGLISSDRLGDLDWRPVTNVGFEGIGFMTANLLVRSSAFQYLGGFDLQFDHPHFREDTDFGWRLQSCGTVPYASDVNVFHPAQPRSNIRESSDERSRFFVKDALLHKKHPERYKDLFFKEQHYKQTPGFSENLRKGFQESEQALPNWMEEFLK